jgi:hypothetical protein
MATGNQPKKSFYWRLGFLSLLSLGWPGWLSSGYAEEAKDGSTEVQALVQRIGLSRGTCVFLGLPEGGKPDGIVRLAQTSELLCYMQSASPDEVAAIRRAADSTRTTGHKNLGGRGFVAAHPTSRQLGRCNFRGAVGPKGGRHSAPRNPSRTAP